MGLVAVNDIVQDDSLGLPASQEVVDSLRHNTEHSRNKDHSVGCHAPEKDDSLLCDNGILGLAEQGANVKTVVGSLNPDAPTFSVRDQSLVHRGILVPDLVENWEHVQRVQLGGVGDEGIVNSSAWPDNS